MTGDLSVTTGWILLLLFLFLSLFNVRKRLPMLPLGSARVWLLLHVGGGALAVGIYMLHTRTWWPKGLYEQILVGLFYAMTLTGVAGYLLQRIYPSRLTQSGIEVIYEQIPMELADIRRQAEALIQECTKKTETGTLARHYLDSLDWFFRSPRFFVSHALGGLKGERWIRHQFAAVRRYLGKEELVYLGRLSSLAELKDKVDYHWAAQSMMKGWLLLHVPLTLALLVMSVWHLILVHVYLL
jgi:hypothetical protein